MSFIPTRPPTTYVNTRLVDYWWCSLPAVCKTKLSAFASMLPHCTVHMLLLKTISLRFSRMKLNGYRSWDGPVAFQRLAHFTTSKPPKNFLWYATFDIPTFRRGMTRVLKNCESHNLTLLFLRRATRVM